MQADSGKISDADVEEYYKKNEANYDQATFNRIIGSSYQAVRTSSCREAKARSEDTTTTSSSD